MDDRIKRRNETMGQAMATLITEKYREFLESICPNEMLVCEITGDLGIETQKIHFLLNQAEQEGLKFIKTYKKSRKRAKSRVLYSIAICQDSWTDLKKMLNRQEVR